MDIEKQITRLLDSRSWRTECLDAIRNPHPRKAAMRVLGDKLFDWINERLKTPVVLLISNYPAETALLEALIDKALEEYPFQGYANDLICDLRWEVEDRVFNGRAPSTELGDMIHAVFDGDEMNDSDFSSDAQRDAFTRAYEILGTLE